MSVARFRYRLLVIRHNQNLYYIQVLIRNLITEFLESFEASVMWATVGKRLLSFFSFNLIILAHDSIVTRFIFPMALQPPVCQSLLIIEASLSHTTTHYTR